MTARMVRVLTIKSEKYKAPVAALVPLRQRIALFKLWAREPLQGVEVLASMHPDNWLVQELISDIPAAKAGDVNANRRLEIRFGLKWEWRYTYEEKP